MVYNVHEIKDPVSGAIKSDGRGKHEVNHFKIKDEDRQFNHINSFLVVDFQYCRAKTNKH